MALIEQDRVANAHCRYELDAGLGTPDDIARGVLVFASDHAGCVTGQVLSIDGGK